MWPRSYSTGQVWHGENLCLCHHCSGLLDYGEHDGAGSGFGTHREIAVQIHSVVMAIGSAMEGLECHVFIGGTPVSQDKARLKKCHIAVGSPGRIKQLIELGFLSTASIRLFVLDEADKLLEEGSFQEQINWIYSSLPANKQMLALSATYPESMAQYLTRYMREPTYVRLNPTDPGLIGLQQFYKVVKSHPLPHRIFEEKVQQLFLLFSKVPFNQALVFSNLHSRAQQLADVLTSKGLPAAYISGGLTQDQRLEAMSKLKQYQCRVLISTDLTSRGIDADKVNLVINLDVPQDWETYMHRIGRAGRFGTHGIAVTYCCHGEEENKMMAIAQKCSLSLSSLPDPIPPSLMEEPSDWDVIFENLNTQPALEMSSQRNKKKRLKTENVPSPRSSPDENSTAMEQASGKTASEMPIKTSHMKQGTGDGMERYPKKSGSVMGAPSVPEAAHGKTRRELQEALPKIPPLPSFKPRVAVVLSMEDLVKDFESFITEGPGRTVEVIRQFTGPKGEDHLCVPERKVSVLSQDYGPSKTLPDSKSPSQSPAHSESSSSSEMDESDRTVKPEMPVPLDHASSIKHRETGLSLSPSRDIKCRETSSNSPEGAEHRETSIGQTSCSSVSRPTDRPLTGWDTKRSQVPTNAQKSPRPTHQPRTQPCIRNKHQISPQTQNGAQARKKLRSSKDSPVKTQSQGDAQREMHRPSDDSAEYWQAYYRAWERYYATVPQAPYQGFHSAYSWMAAYRMNCIYMKELLKR
ncbi:hypothetical protein GJAV_G00192520 [Gymnothorax javanicus]|nr:hypothetical protein GJAV_G00192520 [Gymnothorax javanicus]